MNISTSQTENISEILAEIKFVKGDIRYLELLKKTFRDVNYILHFAGQDNMDKKEMKT